ncbi:DNA repair protein RadC [Serpentinicella sp. ANB-PHB4]|uniref:RadC family protein n=1 Tax=Serpentinicella sp. ANB-PHB4 TaxID=3074076 RepID=UPI00285BDF0B|nr:DNA repair protein RadC [Serpentinicella sp. ANB-PHB4]MDR5657886.1 DNA repair protein RadC [Serpentinicella sp. ANB-PHB4]
MKQDYCITIKKMPECERPREKMVSVGPERLSNAELMAIILSTGTKDMTAIDLAQQVLYHSKEGLTFLANASLEELNEIKGIGLAKACQLMASVELGKRISLTTKANKYKITSPEDASNLMMDRMRLLKKEHFEIILLNTKNELIGIENISIGSLSASIVHPREVFVTSIKRSASSIILVHNHPSGDPSPSKEDVEITKRLVEAGKIIGIRVLDHIIIGDNVHYSLNEMQMM